MCVVFVRWSLTQTEERRNKEKLSTQKNTRRAERLISRKQRTILQTRNPTASEHMLFVYVAAARLSVTSGASPSFHRNWDGSESTQQKHYVGATSCHVI